MSENEYLVAMGPVECEPVSAPEFPVNGKNTGNCVTISGCFATDAEKDSHPNMPEKSCQMAK
jgi:hypothetical protein